MKHRQQISKIVVRSGIQEKTDWLVRAFLAFYKQTCLFGFQDISLFETWSSKIQASAMGFE